MLFLSFQFLLVGSFKLACLWRGPRGPPGQTLICRRFELQRTWSIPGPHPVQFLSCKRWTTHGPRLAHVYKTRNPLLCVGLTTWTTWTTLETRKLCPYITMWSVSVDAQPLCLPAFHVVHNELNTFCIRVCAPHQVTIDWLVEHHFHDLSSGGLLQWL